MKLWPWSRFARMQEDIEKLSKESTAYARRAAKAENALDEWKRRALAAEHRDVERSIAPDGSVRLGSPLAEKLSKLQSRANIYGMQPPTKPRAYVPSPAPAPEPERRRDTDSGMDSMLGSLTGIGAAFSSPPPSQPEFKSGGGGDFGGGGASGSWGDSSSSSSDSDSGSSSSSFSSGD